MQTGYVGKMGPLRYVIGDYHVQIYLDDILLLSVDRATQEALTAALLTLLVDLGVLCHPGKCELDPVPALDFLGLRIHIPTQKFYLTERQRSRLPEKVQSILAQARKQRRQVDRKLLASVLGYFQFCSNALFTGRENLLDLYSCLHQTDSWKPGTKVTLNAPALRLLEHYWQAPPESDQGRPWGPSEKVRVLQLSLSTDASGVAWGAHVHQAWSTTATCGHVDAPAGASYTAPNKNMRGQFTDAEQDLPIHLLEYKAVIRALEGLKE